MPKISLIAAISKNQGLGYKNQLLFKIPEDLKRFKQITLGHAVIMGRKTFESIGRPLPDRLNVVITRDVNYKAEGITLAHSLNEAINLASAHPHPPVGHLPPKGEGNSRQVQEIFIIGGGEIYSEAIKIADKLYLTLVDAQPEADVFFPAYNEFKKVTFRQEGDYNGLKYTFLELEK